MSKDSGNVHCQELLQEGQEIRRNLLVFQKHNDLLFSWPSC